MTVKRRSERIFPAKGVEEEERRRQVTDKPQNSFTETDLFLQVNSLQGHLPAKERSQESWPPLMLMLPKQLGIFFQQRFSNWN